MEKIMGTKESGNMIDTGLSKAMPKDIDMDQKIKDMIGI